MHADIYGDKRVRKTFLSCFIDNMGHFPDGAMKHILFTLPQITICAKKSEQTGAYILDLVEAEQYRH